MYEARISTKGVVLFLPTTYQPEILTFPSVARVVTQGENRLEELALPWPFPFLGQEYTRCYVCTDGFINFSGPAGHLSFKYRGLEAGLLIAPFWDDLVTIAPTHVMMEVWADPDRVIFDWNTSRAKYLDHQASFQLVLFSDGLIRFNYKHISSMHFFKPTVGVGSGGKISSKGDMPIGFIDSQRSYDVVMLWRG
ncbi:MAG: hypothetical protein V3U90_04870 [Dehalococcoidia bacterium]